MVVACFMVVSQLFATFPHISRLFPQASTRVAFLCKLPATEARTSPPEILRREPDMSTGGKKRCGHGPFMAVYGKTMKCHEMPQYPLVSPPKLARPEST